MGHFSSFPGELSLRAGGLTKLQFWDNKSYQKDFLVPSRFDFLHNTLSLKQEKYIPVKNFTFINSVDVIKHSHLAQPESYASLSTSAKLHATKCRKMQKL